MKNKLSYQKLTLTAIGCFLITVPICCLGSIFLYFISYNDQPINLASLVTYLKEITESFQALATAFALIIGGIWAYERFSLNRSAEPKISISHTVKSAFLPYGTVYLHVAVKIKNISTVLAKIRQSEVRIQQILPLTSDGECEIDFDKEIKKIGSNGVMDTKNSIKLLRGESAQIGWHLLDYIEDNCKPKEPDIAYVEPGEEIILRYDFIIKDTVEVIKVYSMYCNEEGENADVWDLGTIHRIPSKSSSNKISTL